MVCYTWFAIFVCFIPLVVCNVELLTNINNVILSDFQVLQQKENKQDFLSLIVDRLEGSAHVEYDVLAQFRNACGNPLNRSVCIDSLNTQCGDIPTFLKKVIEQNSADIKTADLFPAIVFYESVEGCSERTGVQELKREKPTTAQAWGYGIGFVALICTIANIGALMAPFMSKRYFQRILLFAVALAVGTLAGTGMLVLIPESMHLGDEDSPVPDYHLKMITVLAGIYVFYVSERLMKIYFNRDKKKKKMAVNGTEVKVNGECETMVACENRCNFYYETNANNVDSKQPVEDNPDKPKKEVSTVAWMVLIGDGLHNFVDGIAIGAAFTDSVYLGVSVSLAIICEELPHELGDIAILLHAGLSMKRALCYNFLVAVLCFLGLVVGIVVGKNADANTWIFAIAGGLFIYIALVDMLPEMACQYNDVVSRGIESPVTAFIIQNLGLILGFVIILLLVLYGGHAC